MTSFSVNFPFFKQKRGSCPNEFKFHFHTEVINNCRVFSFLRGPCAHSTTEELKGYIEPLVIIT